MNTLTAEKALHEPLTTDAAIEDRTMSLIGTAGSRQLWLMMLDAADHQVPVVIPVDDLPRVPDTVQTDTLVAHLAAVAAQAGGSQLILVWERPGRGKLADRDASWARAVAENCGRRGLRLRAQLLSHTGGVTLLAPADYAGPQPPAALPEKMRPPLTSKQASTDLRPRVASSGAGTGC